MGSPGYAENDVLSGQYSESTDGFAVGVTLLVILTGKHPVDIEDLCCEEAFGSEDRPFTDVPAAQLCEPGMSWPVDVAAGIKELCAYALLELRIPAAPLP
jgi:serine/threonine protein kinase